MYTIFGGDSVISTVGGDLTTEVVLSDVTLLELGALIGGSRGEKG
jgi:hypothetical protein